MIQFLFTDIMHGLSFNIEVGEEEEAKEVMGG
jgi:hypothetical protein